MENAHTLKIDPQFVEMFCGLTVPPSRAQLVACWKDLVDACSKHNLRRVLAKISVPVGSLTVSDIFEMASFLSKSIPGLYLAFVVQKDDSAESKDFFKLTASNRGLTIDFFEEHEKAVEWLRSSYTNPRRA